VAPVLLFAFRFPHAIIAMMYDSMIQGELTMSPLRLSLMQEKGQVTIPTELREKYGLKKGVRVSFVETDKGILLSPQEVVAMEALDQIGAILKKEGLTLEDMIERGRELRGQIVEEQYPRLAKKKRKK